MKRYFERCYLLLPSNRFFLMHDQFLPLLQNLLVQMPLQNSMKGSSSVFLGGLQLLRKVSTISTRSFSRLLGCQRIDYTHFFSVFITMGYKASKFIYPQLLNLHNRIHVIQLILGIAVLNSFNLLIFCPGHHLHSGCRRPKTALPYSHFP